MKPDEERNVDGADYTVATQTSYDRVAAEYAARFDDELAHKPLDRALLDYFAAQVSAHGTIADIGCGPGQIGNYLHKRGLKVVGIDLSPQMVAIAQQIHQELIFQQGSMLALDAADNTWAGIVAFYSLIHIQPADVPRALGEFLRCLQPGGLLLVAFHLGQDIVHLDEWWGQDVSLDFRFFTWDTIERAILAAGFEIEARLERRPYVPVEHPSQRGYLLAPKPWGKDAPPLPQPT